MSKTYTRSKIQDIFINFLNNPEIFFNGKELMLWGLHDGSKLKANLIMIIDKDKTPHCIHMSKSQIVEYINKNKMKPVEWHDTVKWKIPVVGEK